MAAAGGANVLVDLYFVLTGQYFGFDCANDRFTFFRFLTRQTLLVCLKCIEYQIEPAETVVFADQKVEILVTLYSLT